MTGRTPGSSRTPGSGRRKGSLDKAQRALLTDRMAKDLLTVYTRLGGVKWLLQFAQENPAEFLRQGLSRLFPAPQKDDPDIQINQQFNGIEGNPIELARRIAFALAMGLDAQNKPVVEHDDVPYSQLEREDITPQEACAIAPDPERERWAKEAAMTTEERLNAEDIDTHCNRKAFAAPRPAWMDAERPKVGIPKSKRDLL
ncbi:hypothetical protein [Pseudomonas sp.]|uniref:hypothetical protein n=1 Tax=Pseudomonas sp. TaxID=306 RepID=UPI002FCB28B0